MSSTTSASAASSSSMVIPEFIDTSSCLCGLVSSQQKDPNGEYTEKWRCVGDASSNINSGENGKWYNTSLPSQELAGLAQPQNWAGNPPNTSVAYVLKDQSGGPVYVVLGSSSTNVPNLVGNDSKCTAKNNTQLSVTFYKNGKLDSSSLSSSSSSSASGSSSSAGSSSTRASASASSSSNPTSRSSASSGSQTANPTAASQTGSSSTSSSPSATRSSIASPVRLQSVALLAMLFAPAMAVLL